jgi:hypothetical protein
MGKVDALYRRKNGISAVAGEMCKSLDSSLYPITRRSELNERARPPARSLSGSVQA